MSTTYKALLVTADGEDYVTDYSDSQSVEEVEFMCAEHGSRWYFYPFEFVIRDKGVVQMQQRIISAAPPWMHLKGKTVSTALQYLKDYDALKRRLNTTGVGWPE